MTDTIIEVTHLKTKFGEKIVHHDINFEIYNEEIIGLIGGSGSGKTTLLREILMLQKPSGGKIKLFGHEIFPKLSVSPQTIQKRWGVLFQHNALFSSINILDNIAFPLKENTELDTKTLENISLLKMKLVGLEEDVAWKFPSELSGGMQKRAALARALILDPELVFLDEPTAGLDPISTREFLSLIKHLHQALKLTLFIISHDLRVLSQLTNRVAFLSDGTLLAFEPLSDLKKSPLPALKDFFSVESQ